MNPPVPRAWFGLAFFFGVAATFVITRTLESWAALVPVSQSVPLSTNLAPPDRTESLLLHRLEELGVIQF